MSQLVPKDLIGETMLNEIPSIKSLGLSQLVPKDLIGETEGQQAGFTASEALSQLVPKDLIGETKENVVRKSTPLVSIGPEGPHW